MPGCTTRRYHNPVHARNFPDPFVIKYAGEYWAYGTGSWHDERRFGIMHSRDLISWRELGGALEPLPEPWPMYWAPEVSYANGRFYLYYSVGDEVHMHIRVALADHPAGPFVDSGRRLTSEQFAIDAHVFIDLDGSWYLFYATDFLEHSHIGTGTVCDRLLDPLTPAGQPRPVSLPRYDWQVYDPQRIEKGGLRWHTVEGPFVLQRKGRYYQMFSGGNWQNPTYGVSYAISESITPPGEWLQVSDGERVLPVLRTIPGQVVGPGHNSVVRGPDNRQLFCVYHRWAADGSGRQLAIDPLDWVGERLLILGPSTDAQPAPQLPTFVGLGDDEPQGELGRGWRCSGGRWSVHAGAVLQEQPDGVAQARSASVAPSFLAEVSLRALPDAPGSAEAAYGLLLDAGADELLRFSLQPRQGHARITWHSSSGAHKQQLTLPAAFDPQAHHLLRIEVDQLLVRLWLDDVLLRWQGDLAKPVEGLALVTQEQAAAFVGLAITAGWEDNFTDAGRDPAESGWEPLAGGWEIVGQQLWAVQGPQANIAKGPLLPSYELVVNARLEPPTGFEAGYGIYPALDQAGQGPLLLLQREADAWALIARQHGTQHRLALPASFDPTVYQQFRFCKLGARLSVEWEGQALGELAVSAQQTRIGLYAQQAQAAFDMVRVTAPGPD